MDAPSWTRVKEVFQAALERPAGERAAFVRQACGDDDALRAEVEALLRSWEQAGSLVERPAIHALAVSGALTGVGSGGAPALEPGQSLGAYRILELIGAGGMGQVYRARDAKLNRDVALKIVPDAFAGDPERLARFRREAQVLASLNHQNIGHIYGFEDSGARHALVLELVDGPTLAELIDAAVDHAPSVSEARQAVGVGPHGRPRKDGGLPIADALPIAAQIAEALEAAHEQGIVHRDLKPANVKVRPNGQVKVLDFGLARAADAPSASSAEAMESPTMTGAGAMTASGMVLGTAPYMSPEQARGKLVDKRADIWAFGCVLFELLTGRRAFGGETGSDTIASILTREPDWHALPAATPAALRALLQRCLEKDPKRRLRDIGEARIEIERLIGESDKPGQIGPRRRLARWAVLTAVVLLAGAFALFSYWPSRSTGPLKYTQLTDFVDTATAASLSPDGRMVTFIRGGPYFQNPRQIGQIYVKVLPNGDAVQLTNDRRPKFAPVFTPDGSRVAFSVIDAGSWDTWVVPVNGGQPSPLLPNATGLTWLSDGRVLFSEIRAGAGQHMGIVTATQVRAESREIYFPEHERAMAHYSYASPDRKWILIVEMGPAGGFGQRCRLVPFDGSNAGGLVGPEGPCRSAAWSPDGRWMYFGAVVNQRPHIWRQAFPNGTPEQITFDPTEEEGIAMAPDGRSLVTSVGESRSAVWIHDEAGDRQLTSEGSTRFSVLSPDGRHVYYLLGDRLFATELRRVEIATGKTEQVLPGWPMGNFDLSRDGAEVVFASSGRGGPEVWVASLDRRSPPRQVGRGGDNPSFGPGGVVIFRQQDANANYLYRINKDGSGGERILSSPILNKGSVSPDGEWVIVNRSMTTDSSASVSTRERIETVAVPFRGGASRRVCAFNCMPGWSWSHDGKLIYAVGPQGGTMVMPVRAGESFPDLPASGLATLVDVLALPGARVIDESAFPGPNPSTYLFTKIELRRNLFRIELR